MELMVSEDQLDFKKEIKTLEGIEFKIDNTETIKEIFRYM